MSNRVLELVLGCGLAVGAWIHWRYSLWWYMSNRYGTGKIGGKPVRPSMKLMRVVGTASMTMFSILLLIGAATSRGN